MAALCDIDRKAQLSIGVPEETNTLLNPTEMTDELKSRHLDRVILIIHCHLPQYVRPEKSLSVNLCNKVSTPPALLVTHICFCPWGSLSKEPGLNKQSRPSAVWRR